MTGADRLMVAAVRRHLASVRFRDPLVDVWTDRHGTHLQVRWLQARGRQARSFRVTLDPWPPQRAWAFDALARGFLIEAEACAA